MNKKLCAWDVQKKAWRLLNGLNSKSIDLSVISLIHGKTKEQILQPGCLEQLLCDIGLNDEGINEFPKNLHPHCGRGLRAWQYPIQFAPYLINLSRLGVRSYLELGIRHGGSYVATVEILRRFSPLDFSIGVDIIPCPSMAEYETINPASKFAQVNSRGGEFRSLIEQVAPIDLVFIDSHHVEEQCRLEFEGLKDFARMIAFHDISNKNCPGVVKVWEEVKSMSDYQCFEYTQQYEGIGPYMGIGLAVKKERFAEAMKLFKA